MLMLVTIIIWLLYCRNNLFSLSDKLYQFRSICQAGFAVTSYTPQPTCLAVGKRNLPS